MVRDNAELAEQLKAAQAQMARDNENAAERLKASQEQMSRLIAKASEQKAQDTSATKTVDCQSDPADCHPDA